MEFSLFFCYNGNCNEALEYYSEVFGKPAERVMKYGDMPSDPSYPMDEEDKNRIGYAQIEIMGCTVMFCDNPAAQPCVFGDNISPTISPKDIDEGKRLFAALADGGKVHMELQKTFWAELYGMVTDKFGINWQVSCGDEPAMDF